ncbi:hypothetical protein [Pseudoduganella sp. RAF53_2]|jgi:hypothetical protein|uniref:hypothetical protein n=1 Tax=unclassified Pseudoduganella TaxID=2637179 RepID=UPI003F9DA991
MAKVRDFIMREGQGWDVQLYNNGQSANLPAGAATVQCSMRSRYTTMIREAAGATDFLRRNDRLAALLPAAQRMADLQRDCAEALPTSFKFCEILAFNGTDLTLATPNAAVAAKLKQQLPKLQECLVRKGWQINNIRLKVQMTQSAQQAVQPKPNMELSSAAVNSFEQLSEQLEATKENAPLIAALKSMVAKRRP